MILHTVALGLPYIPPSLHLRKDPFPTSHRTDLSVSILSPIHGLDDPFLRCKKAQSIGNGPIIKVGSSSSVYSIWKVML